MIMRGLPASARRFLQMKEQLMLEIRNLTKTYGQKKAVDNLSIRWGQRSALSYPARQVHPARPAVGRRFLPKRVWALFRLRR